MSLIIRKIGYVLLVVLFANIVSASFSVGTVSDNLQTSYAPNSNLNGKINVSFSNQEINSIISSSFGGSIELLNLIQTGYQKTCAPIDCGVRYSGINPSTTKNFNLASGEAKKFGVRVQGVIVNINSVNFTIESNAASACKNQIGVDFLSDNRLDIGNYRSIAVGCPNLKSYGCFSSSTSPVEITVDNFPKKYCQRINLPEAPGFKIGAWVKNVSGKQNITMALYNTARESIEGASCRLPEANSGGEDISCKINYPVTQSQDYLVCIYAEEGTGVYKIKGYLDANGCGFYDNNPENAAYRIFAEGLKYDAVGSINITSSATGTDLAQEMKNYIWNKYGSYDCSSGCFVPFSINGGVAQTVTLKDLKVKYETNLGAGAEANDLYELSEVPALLSSGYGFLDLGKANFSVPSNYGNYTLVLNLNNQSILEKNIRVEKVPEITALKPTMTVAGLPTEFVVSGKATSNSTISSYIWDFGGNQTQTTTTNKITHVYNSTGIYDLKVNFKDSQGLISSRIFNIVVSSPKDFANNTINEMELKIANVKTQVASYPEFYQQGLESTLNLTTLTNNLRDVESDYVKAKTESDYVTVMNELVAMRVPASVNKIKTVNSLLFYPGESAISVDALETASGGTPEEGQDYKQGILLWYYDNMEVKMTYEAFSANTNNEEIPLVSFVKLNVKEKKDLNYNSYFFIKSLGGLTFKENYLEQEDNGYTYFSLTEKEKQLEFYFTENIRFEELPIFISPEFSYIPFAKQINPKEAENDFSRVLFIMILIFLILLGFIAYVALQIWYKQRYEKYLFPNRNDLFNIVNYINNAKAKGVVIEEIEKKLKTGGWKHEQVDYAIKKYSGKKTGMLYEIPTDWFMKLFKKKPVEEKKNPFIRPEGGWIKK